MILFCNVTAGITVIGFQAPMFQELLASQDPSLSSPSLAAMGATLIAISSLFNGFGRLIWGALSDRIGRIGLFGCYLPANSLCLGCSYSLKAHTCLLPVHAGSFFAMEVALE